MDPLLEQRAKQDLVGVMRHLPSADRATAEWAIQAMLKAERAKVDYYATMAGFVVSGLVVGALCGLGFFVGQQVALSGYNGRIVRVEHRLALAERAVLACPIPGVE